MNNKLSKTTIKSVDKIDNIKKEKFIELYRKTLGHITNSCKAAGINRQTYYNWLEKDSVFLKKIMESEMELNDDIRKLLIKKASEGDMTAIIFYLKKRHPDFKDRPQSLQQINVGGSPILGGASLNLPPEIMDKYGIEKEDMKVEFILDSDTNKQIKNEENKSIPINQNLETEK